MDAWRCDVRLFFLIIPRLICRVWSILQPYQIYNYFCIRASASDFMSSTDFGRNASFIVFLNFFPGRELNSISYIIRFHKFLHKWRFYERGGTLYPYAKLTSGILLPPLEYILVFHIFNAKIELGFVRLYEYNPWD